MYVPPSFVPPHPELLYQCIERYGFATLVSQQGGDLLASHLPMLLERADGGHGELIGHLAGPNPQAAFQGGERVLAIFHGPHTYVSPRWYETDRAVPTWNYVAVHVRGRIRVEQDEERRLADLARLVTHYESSREQPWSIAAAPRDYLVQLARAIVAFRVEIESLEGSWKLSQNHPVARRLAVIARLESLGTDDATEIARLMREMLDSNG